MFPQKIFKIGLSEAQFFFHDDELTLQQTQGKLSPTGTHTQ